MEYVLCGTFHQLSYFLVQSVLQVGDVGKIDPECREKGQLLRIGFWSTSLQIWFALKLLAAAKILENSCAHFP